MQLKKDTAPLFAQGKRMETFGSHLRQCNSRHHGWRFALAYCKQCSSICRNNNSSSNLQEQQTHSSGGCSALHASAAANHKLVVHSNSSSNNAYNSKQQSVHQQQLQVQADHPLHQLALQTLARNNNDNNSCSSSGSQGLMSSKP
jgi:hypothetical protein